MRPVRVLDNIADVRQGADGVLYLQSPYALGPYPDRLTDKLDYWADAAPDRIFLADRNTKVPATGWRTLTFAEARDRARAIAQSLLSRGLNAERPIAILSGNSIDHALLALGAMYSGVYYVPIAPAY